MGNFLGGFVLPLLLLAAAFINWSLISFVDLIAFLLIQYNAPKLGYHLQRRFLVLWPVIIFSLLVLLSEVIQHVIWAITGNKWSIADAWWAKLVGLMIIESWKSPMIYFLAVQLSALVVALVDLHRNKFGLVSWRDSCWGNFLSAVEHLGSYLRVASCLVLPCIQLIVGISHPTWVSLPFFVGSCVGLVDWSLTSNFLGLFRWWRPLQLYAGFNIVLLYVYQLPIEFPSMLKWVAEFIGLFKMTADSEWPEICSSVSLIIFYIMLSHAKCDLEEMDFILSMRESNLAEQLLPSKHSFFIRQHRSGGRHSNVLLRGAVFRTFSINFFTYGFPISLFALSFWSFHFTSVCAFGLLAYVGYILYAFPSLFRLHRLNGLLLVFILLWAVSTYIFNVAFTFLKLKLGQDMEIWEMVGLWHYPIPGFFLLAQFCLGILVALGNLVNNSVFLCLSDEDRQSSNDIDGVEAYFACINVAFIVYHEITGEEETKVLIVATIAWGLRKSSRAIMLALIFLISMKPGFIHAVYLIFFFIYLLSHDVSRKIRQSLILLCEAHFAMLYILQIDLISNNLEQKGSLSMEVLSQLGLLEPESSWDFLEIALLGCFCAIHNHGFDMLFSFSAIVQHTPSPPIGFSILKAGLNKSVLLSVYASSTTTYSRDNHSYERRIASFLSAIGQKFLSAYRSFGTYIAFLTILLTVYPFRPNYISFGYLFLLLVWIIGRQLVERTKRRLWFPLKAYAITVFIFIYSLSSFPSFESWLSKFIDLYFYLGYNPEASLENIWESLAVLIVMQLYSYERRQSKYNRSDDPDMSEFGVLGFIRRFLIWHSHKLLFIAVFYASLYPISAFGFLYLLGLVICLTLPKTSRIPSKSFLVYTGFLVTVEYLFQMWGRQAGMFPGQKHSNLSLFLGLRAYNHGFWGLEFGLRGKVLVVAACTLQYNVFRWLDTMPSILRNKGKWEEPCPLFLSEEDDVNIVSASGEENTPSSDSRGYSGKQVKGTSSLSFFSPGLSQSANNLSAKANDSEGSGSRRYSFGYIWGSTKESHKWNKKRIVALRKERLETQKTLLKISMKFWTENMFSRFGLEINMIALLLASFALLNAISMLYIVLLVTCVLLDRRVIRKFWPVFVFLLASILILEYFAIWKSMWPSNQPSKSDVQCHDCWKLANQYFSYCKNCWLGLIVDDPRILISYFIVFMLACFKLHADHVSSPSGSSTYWQMMSQRKNSFVWRDLSFETKSMWTFLDYVRLYLYCHLLDLVLILVLITGTLEYDILHLGYLAFALVFFRLRLEILKKGNKIFKFLRIYNFSVIVLSLAYQSPFVGEFSSGKCETVDFIYEMIGFYKYDYGFRITARSALVEIVIFMLVSLQSYMFSSQEFDYVSRYLEAEQIGAVVREQEKKAAWKTAQLQHICASEETKHHRNLQVEKMKSEMWNLQVQLHNINSSANYGCTSPRSEGLRRRKSTSLASDNNEPSSREGNLKKEQITEEDLVFPFEHHESPAEMNMEISPEIESMKQMESPHFEITEVEVDLAGKPFLDLEYRDKGEGQVKERDKGEGQMKERDKGKGQVKENALISAVQLLGDGVSQVQSIGNQAVNNLASFLNIAPEESDLNDQSSSEDGVYDEMESQKTKYTSLGRSASLQSDTSTDATSLQLGRIFRHIWSQMQSNNDIVCYCCFVLVFLWNFSLLSVVYLAALFLYALCVNTSPSYMFWITMLIYTEVYIWLLYLYQIIIQHCRFKIDSYLLRELGFPEERTMSSFVVGSLPLFLVYLFTLLQSSITVKDGEWISSTDFSFHKRSAFIGKEVPASYNWSDRVLEFMNLIKNTSKLIIRSLIRYWESLTRDAETPPYFVQVSMDVHLWPEDGIQPERIESGINQLLRAVHDERCEELNPKLCPFASRVHVQSIERSQENSNMAFVVFEVVYASPLTNCKSAEWHKSLTPAADVAKEILEAQRTGLFKEMGFPYSIVSVIGGGKREIDLYAYMFGADLAVFFLVAMFYQSVIKNNSEFLDVYQLEDQFPIEFVSILMAIFFLIVLDRIIYLCSFATGKVIFYLFNLILFTYTVTEYAWNMKPQQHAGILALRAIFLAKAVSLALQAVQIRYGIPHKTTLYRQFLTSKTSRINYLCYRLYRALPFLYELRCVLDWSCTTTSLTMYDWLKLEDIYASLYLVKCDAVLNRAQHKQGEKQTKMTKCCNGICLFFILICVIWAPMLMYSSGNPTNIANPIKDASVQVDIKTVIGKLTLYQTTLCKKLSWEDLPSEVNLDSNGGLDTYNKNDVQLICCQPDSNTLWLIPDPVQTRFIQALDRDSKMDITFTWVLYRDRPKGKEVVTYPWSVAPSDLPKQADVQKVLNGSMTSFKIKNVYPRYFRVTGSGDIRQLELEDTYVSGNLVINQENNQWWSFHDINASDFKGCGGLTGPIAVVVSEETPPTGILGDTLSKFSIWGLYITFVLAVGRFIRLQCSDLRMRIPYENLPSCDRLIAICEDIYAARAEGELVVEEVLYWTLVKIYRSPHMLLEYTKTD